ncbi:squalene synthase HpnC [Sphaerisporangium aureirubrum]|uniref:Squalene synthase HpnC n=1 Tax=Sphaerisporangium aureirubrum TaxID=1544736 RepID=A0ABW1NI54_9ACTN
MSSGRDVISRAGRENFPVASRVLTGRYRDHLFAVYGFARHVDDIGDENDPRDRPRLLDEIDADLRRLYAGRGPRHPAVRGLTRTVRECAVPAEPFHRLVEANRRDQAVTRYETFDDLLGYCAFSANPVGHIVLHVFGAAEAARVPLSDRVCSALQVIEHCQDVGEDYRRGRIYLPAEDLRRYGCAERDLAGTATPAPLRRVVAVQAARAARLLDAGAPLLASLSGYARAAVAGYVAGGRATVAALERSGHDVLAGTVRPRRARVAGAWLRALVTGR